jgi:asparagine synthase (glutamine-hydrolysing)
MCGIAGTLGAPDAEVLERMVRRLAHRGPDGHGTAVTGHAALGSTRLSLLDFATGAQPWRSEEGRWTLVFNGEIYNHRALRERLEALGHRFRGYSDTEVVLRAWEAWGPGCVEELEGMFALALSDGERLFLARDFFGQKPLLCFLSEERRRFAFASELKALLEEPAVPRVVDRAALLELRVFNLPLAERSFLKGIHPLPAGGTLWVERQPDGTLRLTPGRHSAPRPVALPEDEQGRVELLAERLRASVRQIAVADHPVGVYLSSGLDSALLAALLVREGRAPIHSFTFADTSEHPDVLTSRALAAALGTVHHEETPDVEALLAGLPRSISILEIPARFSLIETTAPAVRRHVKAVLCGDGADELFAGYPMHAEPVAWLSRCVATYNRLIESGQVLSTDCAATKAVLGRLASRDAVRVRDSVYDFFLRDQLQQAHLGHWDRGAMSAGLEVRLPYLDREVRDIALALPWEWKIRDGVQKYLLRQVARRLLPEPVAEEIIRRRKLSAPSAYDRATQALERRCEALLPEAHASSHPYRLFSRRASTLVELDTFVYLFVVHGGRVPEGFTLERLYSTHLDELRQALRASAEPHEAVRGV